MTSVAAGPIEISRAAVERAVRLRHAEAERAHRRPGVLVFWVAFIVAVPLVLQLAWARAALGIDPWVATAIVGVAFVAIVATTATCWIAGAESSVFAIATSLESAAVQLSILGLVVAGEHGRSAFWLLYLVHALNLGAVPFAPRFHGGLVALGPVIVAAIFFFVRDDVGSAGFALGVGLLGVATYMTQYRAAWRLAWLQVEREALLARAAETQLSDQQSRIARDLHDGLGASLVAMAWQAHALRARQGAGALDAELALIAERAARGVDEMRSAVWVLREPTRQWGDLAAYVVSRVRELPSDAPQLAVTTDCDDPTRAVSGALAMSVLRVAQEAARNALQHARAKRIEFSLTLHADVIALRVCDDGRGFAPDEAQRVGRGGLLNVRVRVEEHGGVLTIASEPGRTELVATFPVAPETR